ncbi:MAG: hypothetical protein PVJ66_02780 [Gammaproteobacteria bacterium]|jgi:hypothetical protein
MAQKRSNPPAGGGRAGGSARHHEDIDIPSASPARAPSLAARRRIEQLRETLDDYLDD